MATQGAAVLDFGSTGSDIASVAVTGQASILVGSDVDAYWMAVATADNAADAHLMAASMIQLVVGDVIAGTGFTIYGVCPAQGVTGTWNVQWVWK
jgi:hypothetical protein